MFSYIVRRLLQSLPTIVGASLVIFFVIQAAPGDFVTSHALNPNISPQQLQNLRESFGLDQPLFVQYFKWITAMLHGDLGLSFQYQQPVSDIIWPRIVNSLWLVLLSTVIFYIIAIPLGIYGAVRQYSIFDRVSSVVMYFLLGFPSFFLALIVIYGLLQLQYLIGPAIPVGGMTSSNYESLSALGRFWDVFKHIAVPALVLAISSVAGFTRYLRGQMLENMNADYVRTARAKGVTENSVIYKHTFRNAVIPFVATIGGLLPSFISGAGFMEVVFTYPGITPMILDSIASQDLYLIAGFTIVTTVLLIIGNILGDLLLLVVDPRIRYA